METPAELNRSDTRASHAVATAAALAPGSAPRSRASAGVIPWIAAHADLALLILLSLVAFWPILQSMYITWFYENAYMEHGPLVVPAAAYMAWTKKDKLKTIARQPSGWGVFLVLWGALQAMFGLVAQWIWVERTAFLVSLTGCIAATYGWRMVRELKYPLCTLILMIAPPTFIFERLTLNLQLLASRLGEFFLETLGFSVLREGNVLEMVGIKLSVEEACSGIRSLMAIFFMCVLYNFFFVRSRSMQALLLALAIPVAILGNALRIVATGVAGQYNPALTRGGAHEAFGYVAVVVAAGGVVGLHLIMQSIAKAWRVHHA